MIRATPAEIAAFAAEAARRGGSTGAGMVPTFADEADLQAAIVKEAVARGWKTFHVYDSRRSNPGFPDLVMIRGSQCVVAELKHTRKQTPSPDQKKWLTAWQGVPGVTVRVWSQEDWQEIVAMLA